MEELVASDAPDTAAAEVAAPVPLLRGKVEFADGKVTWAGKWGFGKEAHANKETGKFEYVATGTAIEAGSTLKFDGWFVLKKTEEDGEEKKVKIKEEGLKLSFASTNGGDEEGTPLSMTLTGSGKNKFGDFAVEGQYSASSGMLQATKTYVEEDEDFSEGEDSGEDSGSGDDEGGDGGEEDDIAAELAALKAEQEEFGLVVSDGSSKRRDKSSSSSSGGGKRLVKRKAGDDSSSSSSSAGADAGDASSAKKLKPAAAASEPAEVLPIPEAPWDPSVLADLQKQLGPKAGDAAGLLEVLGQLASKGRITVTQLQDSGVGKEVRGLKKHADQRVAAKAGAVVAMWKTTVELENK